jgi:hypothetical protein
MKILLPKTLAEPLTIPWERIYQNENAMVRGIKAKLREYMHYLIDHDWTPAENPGNPRFSHESMLRHFRAIVRRMGGLDIYTEYHKINGSNDFIGTAYWIYFSVKKGGRRHAKLFTTDG